MKVIGFHCEIIFDAAFINRKPKIWMNRWKGFSEIKIKFPPVVIGMGYTWGGWNERTD